MPTKVLVVDDSAFMRLVIRDMLASEQIKVITADSGQDALNKIDKDKPDVVTLDVEMPGMNGLDVLKKIMADTPLPVVMLSSHTGKESQVTMDALALGAVDFVAKPGLTQDIKSVRDELTGKIMAACKATNYHLPQKRPDTVSVKPKNDLGIFPECKLVAIGASTGGPKALEYILKQLPATFPVPIMVTQHMPAGFTGAFAQRLNKLCRINVREAQEGDALLPGVAYIAPGGYHMEVNSHKRISLNQNPPVEYVRPSVNVMLESAISVYGNRIVGVILTGMGKDGASAMEKLKESGGRTLAQDQSTALIYSMPKAVIDKGAADVVAPLEQIAAILQRCCMK